MKIYSELKLPPKNEHDDDWGFFVEVEVDLANDPTPIQKENYYKPRYYVLYKQRQQQQIISEENTLEIKQKYENVIVIKISFYVLISMFIFFMLSTHF